MDYKPGDTVQTGLYGLGRHQPLAPGSACESKLGFGANVYQRIEYGSAYGDPICQYMPDTMYLVVCGYPNLYVDRLAYRSLPEEESHKRADTTYDGTKKGVFGEMFFEKTASRITPKKGMHDRKLSLQMDDLQMFYSFLTADPDDRRVNNLQGIVFVHESIDHKESPKDRVYAMPVEREMPIVWIETSFQIDPLMLALYFQFETWTFAVFHSTNDINVYLKRRAAVSQL